MSDFTSDYLALRNDVGAVWLQRDVVAVGGPDAEEYLQGQLAQDVTTVDDTGAWSFLLEPQGKVTALLRIARGKDGFSLDVDAGFGGAVVERLTRFKLRAKVDVDPQPQVRCVALRGAKAHEAATFPATFLNADWAGVAGVDAFAVDFGPIPVRVCELDAYEAVRIEAGWPVMGKEITDKTIPAETGLVERAVSMTKGCYTGQELVARIDSRGGNVPRRLRGVVVVTNVVPPVGAAVEVGGKAVGTLTSVAESLERRAPVALASVHRSIEPPAEVEVTWEGGPRLPARVEAVPLVA